MSSQPYEHDLEMAIKLEERAHRLRMAILRDAEFIAGVLEGYEDAQRDEAVSLEVADRELGWNA